MADIQPAMQEIMADNQPAVQEISVPLETETASTEEVHLRVPQEEAVLVDDSLPTQHADETPMQHAEEEALEAAPAKEDSEAASLKTKPEATHGEATHGEGSADGLVSVPRRLLCEILKDGTCPLHIRVQLQRALRQPPQQSPMCTEASQSATQEENLQPSEEQSEEQEDLEHVGLSTPSLPIFERMEPCMPSLVVMFPLAEILAVRACSVTGLEWVMMRAAVQLGDAVKAHDRIRTRLWIQRVADLNQDSADETVYETPVRRFADDALRRRMETEMADARHHMEQQIRLFQEEVDRRMEQQAVRVHAIVEERVQQQLDTILAVEMDKVRGLVEERVQGRIRAVVQREVHTTVCEMQVRLAVMARENERLQTALLEQLEQSEVCLRSLFWPLSPSTTGFASRFMKWLWHCCHRIFKLFVWFFGFVDTPQEHRLDGLRARMEALRHAVSEFQESSTTNGEEGGGASDVPEMPQSMRRHLLMAIVAAAATMPQNERSSREAPPRTNAQQPALLPEESSAASPVVEEVVEEADSAEADDQAATQALEAGGGAVEEALRDNHASMADLAVDPGIDGTNVVEPAEDSENPILHPLPATPPSSTYTDVQGQQIDQPEPPQEEGQRQEEDLQCEAEPMEVMKDEDGDNDSMLHLSEPPSAEEFEDVDLGVESDAELWTPADLLDTHHNGIEGPVEAPAESPSNQGNAEEEVDEQPQDVGRRLLDEQDVAEGQPLDMPPQSPQGQQGTSTQPDPVERDCCDSLRARTSLLQALRKCRCERRKRD